MRLLIPQPSVRHETQVWGREGPLKRIFAICAAVLLTIAVSPGAAAAKSASPVRQSWSRLP